jgi:hypothetical protein
LPIHKEAFCPLEEGFSLRFWVIDALAAVHCFE